MQGTARETRTHDVYGGCGTGPSSPDAGGCGARVAVGAGKGGADAELIADDTAEIWDLLATSPGAKVERCSLVRGCGIESLMRFMSTGAEVDSDDVRRRRDTGRDTGYRDCPVRDETGHGRAASVSERKEESVHLPLARVARRMSGVPHLRPQTLARRHPAAAC